MELGCGWSEPRDRIAVCAIFGKEKCICTRFVHAVVLDTPQERQIEHSSVRFGYPSVLHSHECPSPQIACRGVAHSNRGDSLVESPESTVVQHLVARCFGYYRSSLQLGVSRASGLCQFYQAQNLGVWAHWHAKHVSAGRWKWRLRRESPTQYQTTQVIFNFVCHAAK